MDVRVSVACPRCNRTLWAHFVYPEAKPCLECPCKALVEVRMIGTEPALADFEVLVIGKWEVTHHLYAVPTSASLYAQLRQGVIT